VVADDADAYKQPRKVFFVCLPFRRSFLHRDGCRRLPARSG
jgi:hypothetical protein